MSFPPPTRRTSWVPGALLLAVAAIVSALLGFALGVRAWQTYLGMALLVVLALGLVERLLARRRSPSPPRARGKLRVVHGGKNGYDLEKDDSTNSQRWLM
jgi:membrane protein implicated in regulation of membrane protease activity